LKLCQAFIISATKMPKHHFGARMYGVHNAILGPIIQQNVDFNGNTRTYKSPASGTPALCNYAHTVFQK